MKKSLAFFALLLLGAVTTPSILKAQDNSDITSFCIHDAFGYVWDLTTVSKSGGVYTGTGTIDVGAGFLWNATVTWNKSTKATTLRADNPQADGCASGYTDYFEYTGTATVGKSGGVVTYSGSGTWLSYCSGSAINSGTWSATDCAHGKGGIIANGPAASASTEKSDITSFCIHDAFGYVWDLTTVSKSGGVYTGTGTVDIGAGFAWNATVTWNKSTKATTLRADNPQADGCASGYTDYFEYTGTATVGKSGGVVTYSGSGTWLSYCSGSAINSGTWSATDCAHGKGGINPNGPAVSTTSTDKADGMPTCIHDAFGYVWDLTTVTRTGGNHTGTGTIDVGSGFLWDATVTFDNKTGATTLRADNPQADGCQSGYTDYFEYTGTAVASKTDHVVTYSGSGSWASYCSGSVINVGTWSATDCAHGKGGINPNGPAKHAAASLIKVSPNPINNQANISYSVAQSGRVNITVYNSMQQVVKVLVNDFKSAGNYSAVWDTRSSNVNAGVYRVVALVNGKAYTTTVQVLR